MSSSAVTQAFAVAFSVLLVTSSLTFGGAIGVVGADHDGSGTSASIAVTPSVVKGIDATDFDTDSYIVTNTGTTDITTVVFDLRGAMLPDSVFDPVGSNVGDTAGKCFTADSGAAATGLLTDGSLTTAPCTDPFSGLHNGDIDQGYDVLTLEFSDFNPGETFTFSADIDPTSITGSVPPGPADSSSVSGLELTGSVVSVTGSDGATVTGTLFADGSDSGAETYAIDAPAAAPTIAVQGVALDSTTLSPAHVAAETASFGHTIVVSGAPAGTTVRLLQTELGLYTDGVPSGGYDLERYEANRVLSQTVHTATADGSGTATFSVTLADTVAEGGYNYFVAAYDDGAGHTSQTSDTVVLQYDANAGVNDAPVIDPIGSRLLQTDATLDISVRATDAEFDPITLSVSGLPTFGTFTDNGDGTGLLSLSPGSTDIGVYAITVSASDGQDTSTETVSVTVTEAKTGTVAYRVNAGGSQIADSGPDWAADTGDTSPYRNSGSSTSFWGSTVSTTTSAVPAETPSGIWQSARWDPISGFAGADDPEMEWEFAVPAGTLTEVRLYFAEGFSGASEPGQRIFDVTIDGDLALDNYDIVADAGYAIGTMKSFTVVSDGTVDIDFGHEFQNPVVSAIEIITFEADPGEVGAVPNTVEFGTVVVDSTASVTVTLTNLGDAVDPAVSITGVSVSGSDSSQFDATLTGPTTIAPGESTTVEVEFLPTTAGTKTGTLVVDHDGSNSPVLVGLLGEASASSPVGFTPAGVDVTVNYPTSLQWGPDGRLYVSEQFGRILALTIERTGAAAYTVTDTEVITAVQSIPNHDDDGSRNASLTTRQVTGLLVTGTASQPVLYVSSSDPRIGGQSSGADLNLDTNSGIISRLTKTASGWEHVQLVRGLPRSEENHAPNGMALDPATNTLYLAQGGNTGQGAPSKQLGYLSEYAYAAAILDIDLDAIDALPTVDGVKYDLPTLQGSAEPFGGQDGLNQAIMTADSPVQVYSPGYRNPYDIVRTTDGRLYAVDNGGSGGWGDVPVGEGTAGVCTNAPNDGGLDKIDQLHLVTEGFYAGHANPTRANPDGAGVYSDDGTLLLDFTSSYTPVPFSMANPIECDARDAGDDGSLTSFADSTNGITEYTASNFGGAMQGDLLTASFTTGGPIWRIGLNAAGDQITQKEGLLSNFGSLPLDVTAVGDDGLFPGTVWAVAYGAETLIVFEPDDYEGATTTCTGANDPNIDEDGDGFSNADEIAAGTNPCSAGSKPADADGDGISDVSDPDDDNDGIPDTTDAFAVDATNGATALPLVLDFEAGARPNTLFDMGLTGLLTNGTDYLDLFVADRVAAGGIAGVFTVPAVEGTARGASNTQAYGFQTGVTAGSDPFVVSSLLETPFPASDAPVAGQAAGIFLGTGDQDNYVAIFVTGDSGASGPGRVEMVREVGGTAVTAASVDAPEVVGDANIDLRLRADPITGDVTASFVVDGGSEVTVGTTLAPTTWFDGSGLAVGIMATSAGPAGEFSATYDGLSVVPESVVGNTAPVLASIGGQTVTEGTTLDVGVSATDAETDPLTITASGLPAFATLTDAGDGTATLSLSPTSGDAGSYDVTVSVSDGTLSDSEVLTITVQQATSAPSVLYRVNAGGPSTTGGDGPAWADDSGTTSAYRNSGSNVGFYGTTISTFDGSVPAETPAFVFYSARWDPATDPELEWAFDVPAGTPVEVRLYFGEAYSGTNQPGQRVFDVTIDGTTVLNDYDVVADVGFGVGTMHAFTITSDGTVDIDFGHVVENPKVVAIELLALGSGPANSPPVLSPTGDQTVLAGESVSIPVSATDVDGDTVTLDASGLPAYATFTDNGAGSGTLVLAPGASVTGSTDVTITASDGTLADSETITVTVLAPPSTDIFHRVNAGGPAIGASDGGPDWTADSALDSPFRNSGSTASTYGSTVASTDGTLPAGTPTALFGSARWDAATDPEMQWAFAVPAGTAIEVRLYFAEAWSGASSPGDRVFDVAIDGTTVLNDYDIVADAGFATGTMRSFTLTSDGTVDIDFTHVTQNPIVSAIEIVAADGEPVAQRPTAVASADPDVALVGEPVAFDGRTSSDIDGTIATYAWDFDGDGTVDATGATVSHAFTSAGEQTVTLTVVDNDGLSDTDTVTVAVSDPTTGGVLYRVNAGGSLLSDDPNWLADASTDTTTGTAYRNAGSLVSTSSSSVSTVTNAVPAGTPIGVFHAARWDPADGAEMAWAFDVPAGTAVEVRLYFVDGYSGTSTVGARVFDVAIDGTTVLNDYDIVADAGFATGTMHAFTVTSDGTVNVDFGHVVENPIVAGIEIVSTGA